MLKYIGLRLKRNGPSSTSMAAGAERPNSDVPLCKQPVRPDVEPKPCKHEDDAEKEG